MDVQDIHWRQDEHGFGRVCFRLDGVPAYVQLEAMKTTFLEAGYVLLSPAEVWRERLEPVTIPAGTLDGVHHDLLDFHPGAYLPSVATSALEMRAAGPTGYRQDPRFRTA